jgi:hypothetical protein
MKSNKSSSTKKYLYVGSFILLSALAYGAYKTYGPQPVDINEVYNKTAAPAVVIQGNDVYVKDGQLVPKGTEGAKWVPPGTYAGMPGDTGRNISGYFFTYAGSPYGTFVPTTAAERQAAADFTNAVRQAAGNTSTTTNTNQGKGGLNNQAVGNTGAQLNATPTPIPATPIGNIADLNKDGKINVLDYNLFVINYNKRGDRE